MTRVLQVMAGAEVGGAEEFFMRLVPALSLAGTEQRAVIRHHASRQAILRDAGVDVRSARFGGLLDFTTRRVLQRQIREFAPEIVLAWMSRAAKYAPAGNHVLAARLGGYYPLKNYRHCDHLIGNTEAIRDYLVKEGWPAERAWYIPNFVDGTRAPPRDRAVLDTPADTTLLLALGRLHRNKAFDVLIEALSDIPNTYLWIAGDGPLMPSLRSEAERLGLRERVRFLGWQDDTAALLAAADILVCPSRHEPLGNVVIEGWAHGLPVVAAASDGPRKLIVDRENGLLVPVDDADALAAAITELAANVDLSRQLAARGLTAYEGAFTQDKVVRQYQAFFEKVTS